MANSSFDVVSELDRQELKNAVAQMVKELSQRFDFKGSISNVELTDTALVLTSDDAGKLNSVVRIVEERLIKRGISIQALDFGAIDHAIGGTVRQEVTLRVGLPTDQAKIITKAIKAAKSKVQASIQGDSVRISGKKRDDLQAAIALIKDLKLDRPVQFTNYR